MIIIKTKTGEIYAAEKSNGERLIGLSIEGGNVAYGDMGPIDKEEVAKMVADGYAKIVKEDENDICTDMKFIMKISSQESRGALESFSDAMCKKNQSSKKGKMKIEKEVPKTMNKKGNKHVAQDVDTPKSKKTRTPRPSKKTTKTTTKKTTKKKDTSLNLSWVDGDEVAHLLLGVLDKKAVTRSLDIFAILLEVLEKYHKATYTAILYSKDNKMIYTYKSGKFIMTKVR